VRHPLLPSPPPEKLPSLVPIRRPSPLHPVGRAAARPPA
jgi:hypothetical protein